MHGQTSVNRTKPKGFLSTVGFRQRHSFGDREVLVRHREGVVGVAQAALPQGRLSEWKEHHPDHRRCLLLCKIIVVNFTNKFAQCAKVPA